MPRSPDQPPPSPQQESLFGSPGPAREAPPRRPGARQGPPRPEHQIADNPLPAAERRAAQRQAERAIYTVSRLNNEVRGLLERSLRSVWVEGEISNLSRPSSGHVYFTLKDGRAQIRCALFRQRARASTALRDGLKILVRGQLTVYEARGEYQIQVDTVEETGEGALRRAFEVLKRKLAAEGLFAPERKRPLPTLPHRIGVLTSPTGAAIRDVLHVLARRFPAVPVRLYPIPVQGAEAAPAIVRMLRTAVQRRDCDVLLLTRGGGSLEDLWAFNEERVARAIAACDIPVVSAVGHETDITIADFVADYRAPTPSAAAETLVPDAREWLDRLQRLEQRCVTAVRRQLRHASERVRWVSARVQQQHPASRLRQGEQRVDELTLRMQRQIQSRVAAAYLRLGALEGRLNARAPSQRVVAARTRLEQLTERLSGANARLQQTRVARLEQLQRRLASAAPTQRLTRLDDRLNTLGARLVTSARRSVERSATALERSVNTLHAVSPLATLARGYAIVEHNTDQPRVVRAAEELGPGEEIRVRLGAGEIDAEVTRIRPTVPPKATD